MAITIPRPMRKIEEPEGYPLPTEFGMPDKFTKWRPGQIDSLSYILHNDRRFVFLCAPTGFGKTGSYVGAHCISGKRTMVLTCTKGLQDQISEEFVTLASDIRGLSNYLCPIARDLGVPENTNVGDAPCQCGMRCSLRYKGCTYYDAYRAAQKAGLVVTNYQCWLYDALKDSPIGDLQYGYIPEGVSIEEEAAWRERQGVKILVLDEAHDAAEELSRFIGIELSRGECLSLKMEWPDAGLSIDDWNDWAVRWLVQIRLRMQEETARLKVKGASAWSKLYKHLRDMERKLDRLAAIRREDDWIANEVDVQGISMRAVQFNPLMPARYAERYLFRGIDRVVLVSATVRPKTADMLGISESEMDFQEYDSNFHVDRRPVIFVPTVQMNYRNEQDDGMMTRWLGRIDQIVRGRLDRKGIVHAVSYSRSKFITMNSEFKRHMYWHTSENRAEVVERFKRAAPPAILVSPSVDTGYDFMGDLARYQIIGKIPFASTKDRIVKARQERDPEYGLYMAAQTLVQMIGRVVRSETDWAETFIIDDQAKWFIWKIKKFLPKWMLDSYRIELMVPEPLSFQVHVSEIAEYKEGDIDYLSNLPNTSESDRKCVWCNTAHEGGPENCPQEEFGNNHTPGNVAKLFQNRSDKREAGADALKSRGIRYRTNNNGVHLMIDHDGIRIDFWPGTGKWIAQDDMVTNGRGVDDLLQYMGVGA